MKMVKSLLLGCTALSKPIIGDETSSISADEDRRVHDVPRYIPIIKPGGDGGTVL